MRRATTAVASAFWFGLGCAPAVQPGLTNAPALDGSRVVDPRVHDVIANGEDSCGRRLAPDPGPLRYRFLPCRRESSPTTSTAIVPSGAHDGGGGVRWMEHYYFGWPCKAKHEAQPDRTLFAWSPILTVTRGCGSR
jgi:hypothetical protein